MVAPSPGSPTTGTSPRGLSRGAASAVAISGSAENSGGGDSSAGDSVRPRSLAADLLELTKPRIVTMILVTTVIAALIAAGSSVTGLLIVHLLLGVAMVAGSAGAMNQVWEHQIDGRMRRTEKRPLPAGRIGWGTGLAFAAVLGVTGSVYLWVTLGAAPAIFAVLTWVLYVPIYTPMKVRSEWNTTVGAVSGALPMMIGYTAAGGGNFDPIGWLLVGVLMAWQFPHFMAIAWLCRDQYAGAGFQMTTTVEPTGSRAGWQSVVGMAALVGCLVALAMLMTPSIGVGVAGLVVALVVASYPMTAAAVRFAIRRDDLTARKLLRASLLQLPASLLLLTVAALVWGR